MGKVTKFKNFYQKQKTDPYGNKNPADSVAMADRKGHGYNPGEDAKAYEKATGHDSIEDLNIGLQLGEARQVTPELRAAQKNTNASTRGSGVPPRAKTWKQHLADAEKEHKDKFKEHKKAYDHHKGEIKNLKDSRHDLKSGNLGFDKNDKAGHRGAEEEINSQSDHHYSRMQHHLNKMHHHNDHLDKPYQIKESIEDLDEISQMTARSYHEKAFKDSRSRSDNDPKQKTRDQGMRNASNRMKDRVHYKVPYNRAYGSGLRHHGRQIDELSKQTLAGYIKKSSSSMASSANQRGAEEGSDTWDKNKEGLAKRAHLAKKELRRYKGINLAAKKLSEESDQIDELSRETLGRYTKRAKDDADYGGKERKEGRWLAGKKRWGGTGGIPAAKVPGTEKG